MSLKTWIANFMLKLKLLFGTLEPELKSAVHTGVVITEGLKNFVDSPVADILTSVIPGPTDDLAVAALRQALPAILINLRLVDEKLAGGDPNQIVLAGAQVLSQMTGDVKSGFLHSLSVLLAQVAADGKLSWSDGVLLLQWFYKNNFKAA